MQPVVLVLTNSGDTTADRVVVALREVGAKAIRFDTADFPLRATVTAEPRVNDAIIIEKDWAPSYLDLQAITTIWYRRPGEFAFSPDLTPHETRFAMTEAVAAMAGLFRAVDCRWVSHPTAILDAQFKAAQLPTARRLGFDVPRTMITNNPVRAREFLAGLTGDAIIKAFDDPAVPYLMEDPQKPGFIFTSRVQADQLDDLVRVRHTACLFQELIPKKLDLRVTVVGDRIFTTAIDSQSDEYSEVDWRVKGAALEHRPFSLPEDIEEKIRKLMRLYRLNFAAVDLALTPDGEYKFLEINPNGEWEWIEERTSHRITEAMCSLLTASAG